MKIVKKISLLVLIAGYFIAGLNHFYNPASYVKIIPDYLPFPLVLNYLSGVFEILFAALLISTKTRKLAAYGIVLMLTAFLPVHITMLIDAPMQLGKLTVTPALAWVRLLLQPLLMLWAWWHRR
ncbi:DoxX family protein [Mucilaginibacter pallidiroseus]|uniref:DoxX family protein n=1 Tax=Mucilaginibacter pallidiroseus TaxID=2599295 RepID=A0A563U4X2_9SPHI|nr:DoxX family protein [Mucilaginibacter pallidiroseus]TWR26373.1 DoxX family protein [Mucilaginibacter pallidiroseus]